MAMRELSTYVFSKIEDSGRYPPQDKWTVYLLSDRWDKSPNLNAANHRLE